MFRSLRSTQPFRALDTLRLLALISFCGQLYFFVPVMTPYFLQRNLTIAEIAGLQTMLIVSSLVMEIPTGVLADRFGHVWSYRTALVVLASGQFLFLFARDYEMFLVVQFITGTGFAFSSGSLDAIIYEHLPEGDRVQGMQRATGVVGAANQMGSVVAYSIGGIITADLTLDRMTITIVMSALAVSTAAALSFGLQEAPHVQARERQDSRQLLGIAWRAIRHTPALLRLMALAIMTNAFGAHLLVFYQQYFLDTGVPGAWFGLGLSLASVVVVVVSLSAWRLPRWLGTRRAMLVATGVPGLLYLAMSWNDAPWSAVALFVVQWGAIHVAGPLFSGLSNAHLPDEARATGLSLINAVVTLYTGLGGVILGWLAAWSLQGTFALLGVVIVAGAVAIQVDERPTRARPSG